MARFLLTVWPLSGHLYPNLALAHALRKRGHEVGIYTGPSAEAVVRGEGFEFFGFQKVDGKKLDRILFTADDFGGWWKQRRDRLVRYTDWLLGMLPEQVEDVNALLASFEPDVLVCDPMMWGPLLVVRELHPIPVAVFVYVPFCLIPSPKVPLPGLGLAPARNWMGRQKNRLTEAVQYRMTAGIRRGANDVRKQYGLGPMTETISELAGRMPLYIITGTPELDYARDDLPATVHYVGPCLWSKPASSPPPAWMEALPRDRPVVHVSEGTVHAKKPLVLSAAARGLADLKMSVIMATGTQREPSDLGLEPLASNIRVERWVTYEHLLPRTDLVVTTAGAGTALAALELGIPLVMIPTEWDKPEVARRVAEAGAGLLIEPSQCTPERLRQAVERVLAEPSFRENARRLAAGFKRYGGPAEAAQLLEDLKTRMALGTPA